MAPLLVAPLLAASVLGTMVNVGPGEYRPLYPVKGEETVAVPRYLLDVSPVTNGEFLSFVGGHPEWRRDRINSLFADQSYLQRWAAPTELGPRAPAAAPVVEVSWYAARAYCESRGARLPTEAEWEFAAAASESSADAGGDPAWLARVLAWYGSPTPMVLPPVGQLPANVWGVRDLHGLVWEWVEDFNATLVAVDNRDDKDPDRKLYCGSGAVGAAAKEDYAAFMRAALRSSLSAEFTTGNLGFRCARLP